MQYIYKFLLMAAGHDEAYDLYDHKGTPKSQLTCDIEIIPMDPIISVNK